MSSSIGPISDLSAQEKRAFLAQLLQEKANKSLSFPLSFAQERLWFLNQFEPDSPVYNVSRPIRIQGVLNVEALRQALEAIVSRHESLRTTFATTDRGPVQVIQPVSDARLSILDFTSTRNSASEIQNFLLEEVQRPFDLSRGPLFRASLLRLDEEEHILLLIMHHIVSDGWSMGILFQELAALYETYAAGKPSSLPELPIQYADFAVWQRQWLREEVLEAQFAYWKQQLGSHFPVLELPTDRPRPAVQTFRGARHSLVLPQGLSEGLKVLSRQEGVTLFMTLLAAFKTLLYRYTGQDDIIVGAPIANRNRSEIEGLIGFFVNTLVLRTDLSGNPTFRELLGRVRAVALGAYAHQDLPFEKLVEALHPERDLSHNPLFQVMFILQNAQAEVLTLSGLTVHPLEVDTGTAKFDLTLSMIEGAEGLKGTFEYNTDLFDAITINRMVGHFEMLLEGIIADSEQRLSDLPLLTEAERHQLLAWNETTTDYPQDQCICQLFEAQVERTPEAVAVVFEDQQLTYRELNARANRLAHYLKKRGVGPEVLVGICVERSLEMAVGLLGILKAGGAYVSLDPAYPKERLAFMVEDAQVPVLLTLHRLVAELPEHGAEVVCLDSDWEIIAQESVENPISEMTAENLVYVIYTSGSTGRPKGVALPQRALLNLIIWQLRHSTLAEGARTLQFTSLSFDVSFQEIFSTWCSGGILVMVTEAVRQDGESLARYIAAKAIERLFLPFVALQHLAEAISTEELRSISLKEVITAGEQLRVTQPIIRLFTQLKDCSLHNQYGPSESHVVTTFALVDTPDSWPTLPPIGRPIANTQIYLLDAGLQPIPVGVPGELYIGGVSLAQGYLNRPDLTAEKFILHPFSNEPGARLYKTGDLARYLPDGNIEFLGRTDHQVKIRGFRVELGEIEMVLGQHIAIQEAVVVAHEDVSGNKRLVAYVVSAQEQALTVSELRNFLKEKLPDYMVPSVFVMLDTLPLTPNGKIDRRALPAPDTARPELERTYVAPRTLIEQTLTEIWAEVLRIERIGIYDNFFELGGHSLLATQVISRVREAFQVETPLRSLFESPTVADLAVTLLQREAEQVDSEMLAQILAELEQVAEDKVQITLASEKKLS